MAGTRQGPGNKTPRAWYRFQAQAGDPSVAEILVFDFIGDWIDDYFGFGVTAKAFVDELAKLSDSVKTIRLRVNSPGGDVFGAITIANALRDQRTSKQRVVDVVVEGLAASAATIITSAGTTVRIAANALMMIHNPWSWAVGEAAEMRKAAEELDKVRDAIIATYRWRSELSEDELGKLMDAVTWMDADEAIANGLADEKVEGLKAAASVRPEALARLGEVPEPYRAKLQALAPAPETEAPAKAEHVAASASDILRECKAAGCLELAEELLEAKLPLDQVQARVAAATQQREASEVRAREIRALCATARRPDFADEYVKAGVSVEFVRAQLTRITALLDRVEIDAHLDPAQGTGGTRAQLSARTIYRERNGLAATTGGKA